ncbi:MAG: hypothetical protein ACKOA3_03695 [Sphingomonadales bacterium]
MKNNILFVLSMVLLSFACNKDKFTSEPQVQIKSIQPSVVVSGNVIKLLANYTDQEGDIDSIYIVYKWFNAAGSTRADTLQRFPINRLGLPGALRKADIQLQFEYNTYNQPDLLTLPGVLRDTTASFGLVLIDKTRKRSNYSESARIRLRRP